MVLRLTIKANPDFPAPKGVTLRILGVSDVPLLVEHLTGLDDQGRHDRFNGSVDLEGIANYARRCIQPGVMVIGAEHDGHIIGVAELHPATLDIGEAAFSVNAPWRGNGLGAALFALILEAAWSRGLRELDISTHSDNEAMKHLARRFDAEMTFDHGEGTGRINLEDLRISET